MMDYHSEQRLDSISRELRTASALMNGLDGDDFNRLGIMMELALAKAESMSNKPNVMNIDSGAAD